MIDILLPEIKLTPYELFLKSLLNIDEQIIEPERVLEIVEMNTFNQARYIRTMTLQNISCIQGKAKSGKSFLLSMLIPAIIEGKITYSKFISQPKSATKRAVIYFDTEQGDYDAQENMRRMLKNCNIYDNFAYSRLREYTPAERLQIIDKTLEHYAENLQFVVIDGIIDLITSYNDETQATEILSHLLKWSKIYNCHICVVIHENKGKDNAQATGWLGRFLYQKAETIMSISNTKSRFIKLVKSEMQRGTMGFSDFEISIDCTGNGTVCENENEENEIKQTLF